MRNLINQLTFGFALLLGACSGPQYDEASVPDEHRFTQEVFLTNLNEPVELEVLPNGQILFVQRKGGIKLYDPQNMRMVRTDSIAVFYGFEDGLMGMAVDPNFDQNNWLYLYYSPVGDEPKQHLSRFVYDENGLSDEKVILIVPTQRDECCHTGGSIEFGSDGLLYLSTGDDTNPFKSEGFAPIDDQEGRSSFDARRTSSNTNDLRGKILRIKPEDDGTYSIPAGNLFEDNDPKTRPEIYVMGCRNPYRITVDQKRGWLFWGDVGPDAGDNDSLKGPRGHDEMNVAMKPGYYGWPLFIADNKAYGDRDFETQRVDGYFDPKNPINDSKYNTGIKNLPAATPAMIFYPYSPSEEFPQLGQGGRTAMTGPVFYTAKGMDKKNGFPSYFDERLFIYDWMRDWVYTVKVDENGVASDYVPFTPSADYRNIIDMDFGNDGMLYMIEYGTAWFKQNEDAKLSRISFDRGNRTPVMKVKLSESVGSSPLTVTLDASDSEDYDGDDLKYVWKIGQEEFESASITYTFTENGVHYPRLTLTDGAGHTLMEQFKIEVGNDAPVVDINIKGNKTFYWPGRNIQYDVSITDKQDGTLNHGIEREEVNFDILYMDGFDQAQVLGHQMPVTSGEYLISKSDCMSCHKINDKSVGPSFVEVSNRYKTDPDAIEYLSAKIIKGGSGAWGDHAMSAHPDFTQEETQSMVEYVLSLGEEKPALRPLKGIYTADDKEDKKLIIISAQYEDKGAQGMSNISAVKSIMLKSNVLKGSESIENKNIEANKNGTINRVYHEGWLAYDNVDLTDIVSLELRTKLLSDQPVLITVKANSLEGSEIGKLTLTERDKNFTSHEIPLHINTGAVNKIYLIITGQTKDQNLVQIQTLKFNPHD
ncbi:PQQ-dependent sugar dehydrogenase [Reichenbachiella agarivorans]|uniref:PQQ-dependent sugar dehydrogenase n=1 Tax=Reichenbachiella agarivorans TaxID=2979464 RepID=A0ABY6CN81_9BACT|nr:PQQ-dependent sugar dehydrogenase [Reichenbachiella agarivorans]UXP31966.1 PQQ-dependent sugar dehydrogenase [Reichenbachiella agarivorans]